MFYNVLYPLSDSVGFFNLFQYLTFRTAGAILTALVMSLILGPGMIRWLKAKQKEGQPIRKEGPESHIIEKAGTPTMGGVLILFSLGVSTLLWADLNSPYVWMVLLVTLGFGAVGFVDDYLKLKYRNTKGVPGRIRLLIQFSISLIATLVLNGVLDENLQTSLALPFLKDTLVDLGWFYFPFAMLVVVGSANAVNLTDGLDGLAIVPVMISTACFGLIAYLVGNLVFADYLHVYPIPGAGELSIFCGALIGASLGFLWFNAPPAMVFMGDTGSLALGAALGMISVITKHEVVLAIVGGIFVLETVSVIVQVASYKLTGKRVFRMAPIHHHFEKKGWAEPTIVIRFWIISVILALIGLSTLKLR